MAIEKDFEVFRGDSFIRTLRFLDSSNKLMNISGWTIFFTIKYSYELDTNNDDNAIIKKDYPISNGTSGTQVISLTKEETASIPPHNYKYDIKIDRPGEKRDTIFYGNFLVRESVTKRD